MIYKDLSNTVVGLLLSHPKEQRCKPFFVTKNNNSLTMNDLIYELENNSKIAIEFLNDLLKLTIDLLARKKIKL